MEGGGVLQPSPFTPLELGSSTSARISFIFSLSALQILFDLFLSYLLIWKVGISLLILHVGRFSCL